MNGILCQECQNMFGSKGDYYPQILPCGHTYCSTCIQNKIKNTGHCPNRSCQKKFSSTAEFPYNESLFSVCRAFLDTRDMTNSFLQTFVKIIEKNLRDVNCSLGRTIQNYDIVKSFQQGKQFDSIMQQTKNSFNKIKINFQILNDKIFPKENLNFIDIENLSTSDRYASLTQLKRKLENGEKIYASGFVNDLTKYGQVVLKGDDVFVNSLNCVELEDHSSYFWLYDFKDLFFDKICPFFTLPCIEGTSEGITLIFDIVEGKRNSGFVELCTGETGIAFKNSMYDCKDKDTVELNMTMNDSSYVNYGNKYKMLCEEEIVIRFVSSKKLEIKRLKKKDGSQLTSPHNVIGKLINEDPLSGINPSENEDAKIMESGLAVLGVETKTEME